MSGKVWSGVTVSVLAYLLIGSYEISRSTVESLFLESYGSSMLPWAWLAVAGGALVAVGVYNLFVGRVPLVVIFAGAAFLSAAVLAALLAAREASVPGATFLLYVWKDVHIVVLLEILWTFANVVFPLKTARWAYGVFLVVGSSGGLSGGILAGELALRWGTRGAAWAPTVIFVVLAVLALGLFRVTRGVAPARAENAGLLRGLAALRRSPYLPWLLLLVALVQIVITLVDFRFNEVIEATFPDTDERTRVIGQVYAAINVAALLLQMATGPVLYFVGVPLTLLAIPFLLGGAIGSHAIAPRFELMAATKVASKAFDYSLFKAAKELLYIPLGYAEKTAGKSLVDMLGYRAAKAFASLVALGLLGLELGGFFDWLTIGLVAAWLVVALVVGRRFRGVVPRERELGR
jgi:ATP/ADP translocase